MTENAPAETPSTQEPPAGPQGPGEQKTLDSLGISKELADNAKLMWLITAIASIFGPIIFGYLVKKEGQDDSAWYQDQIKKNWFLAIGGIILTTVTCGLGWIVVLIIGIMAFMQIGEGKDPHVFIISPKGFQA
jgi:uncharacterized membrane protein